MGIQIALEKPAGDIFFQARSNHILPLRGNWSQAYQARHT